LIKVDEKTKFNNGEMVMITKDSEGKEYLTCFESSSAGTFLTIQDVSKFFLHFPVKMAAVWDSEKKGSNHVITGLTCAHNQTCYSYTITLCKLPVPSSGKFRFDITCDSIASDAYVGLAELSHNRETNLGSTKDGWGYSSNGYFYNEQCKSYGASWTKGDVLGIEVDMDLDTLTFYKNNDSQGVAQLTSSLRGKTVYPACCSYYKDTALTLMVPALEQLRLTGGSVINPKQHGLTVKVYPSKWTKQAKEKMVVDPSEMQEVHQYFSQFDRIADENLIDLISDSCDKKKLNPLQIHPLQLEITKREIDQFDRLRTVASLVEAGDNEAKITAITRARFSVIQKLNQKLKTVFPLMDLGKARFSEGIASQLMACRGYILGETKKEWLEGVLKRTMSSTSFPYITVNRPLAITKRGEPPSDETLLGTIFGQCFKALDKECDALRQKDRAWHVDFQGEHAIDAGGPYREMLTSVIEELEMKHVDMFVPCPNAKAGTGMNREKFLPAPVKNSMRLKMFRFIGKLCGIAIRTQNPIQVNWPSLIWKQLVRQPLLRSDIAAVDSIFIKCIDEMLEIDKKGVTEEMFSDLIEETFTTYDSSGNEVELLENGRNVKVTFQNRLQYVELQEEFRKNEFHQQCEAMRLGLATIAPIDLLELHTWKEIELLVTGKPDIDLEVLKRHTKYNGHKPTDKVIMWFWEAMESYTPSERQRFVRFVWGRARLPLSEDGWSHSFTISSAYRDNDAALPESHTCFFTIDLPKYSSLEILTERVKYAFTYCISIDND